MRVLSFLTLFLLALPADAGFRLFQPRVQNNFQFNVGAVPVGAGFNGHASAGISRGFVGFNVGRQFGTYGTQRFNSFGVGHSYGFQNRAFFAPSYGVQAFGLPFAAPACGASYGTCGAAALNYVPPQTYAQEDVQEATTTQRTTTRTEVIQGPVRSFSRTLP